MSKDKDNELKTIPCQAKVLLECQFSIGLREEEFYDKEKVRGKVEEEMRRLTDSRALSYRIAAVCVEGNKEETFH